MFKFNPFKPFGPPPKVTYEKISEGKIKINVSSNGVKKSITASVVSEEVAKEIEELNATSWEKLQLD